MKKRNIALGCIIALSVFACDSNRTEVDGKISTEMINNPSTADEPEIASEDLPVFEFEEEVIDFGEIAQGEKVKKMFRFKNIGKTDLIISDAKGSCGCTVPTWPRNPIAPGAEAEIEVVFDSNGKQGRQHKTVTLVANTVPNTKVIAIKGDILSPEQNENQEADVQ